MSIKDLKKKIIITDCLTGNVIFQLNYTMFNYNTLEKIISDLFYDYVYCNEHGISITIGYEN